MTLSWTPPACNGGAAITKYQYEIDGGGTWTDIPDSTVNGANETSYTVTSGITDGTAHSFKVRGVSSEGDGTASDAATATPMAPPSTDATLSGLTLSEGTLTPDFATTTTSYMASVENSVSQITVTPTTTHASSTVELLDSDDMALTDADAGTESHQVALAVGDNTIKVKVTAQDTATTRTHTVRGDPEAAAADARLGRVHVQPRSGWDLWHRRQHPGDGDVHVGGGGDRHPALELDVGGMPKTANYESGSATTTVLVFKYEVAEGDLDDNGIAVGANKLALPTSVTIVDASDNTVDAVLTHDAVAADSDHRVDGVKPTFVSAETSTGRFDDHRHFQRDPPSHDGGQRRFHRQGGRNGGDADRQPRGFEPHLDADPGRGGNLRADGDGELHRSERERRRQCRPGRGGQRRRIVHRRTGGQPGREHRHRPGRADRPHGDGGGRAGDAGLDRAGVGRRQRDHRAPVLPERRGRPPLAPSMATGRTARRARPTRPPSR